jgi:hypothetical protein
MSKSIRASRNIRDSKSQQKKIGRPATTGPGLQVVVRLHEPILSGLDEWCLEQPDRPSRAEGMRRLTGYALQVQGELMKASGPSGENSTASKTASQRRPVKRKTAK